MKTSKFLFLGMLSLGLAFTACKDDKDEDPPAGTCEKPTNVIIDAATASSVTLKWNSAGSSWTIEYGESGFSQGNGVQVQAETNPYTINGLDPQTSYDFYVRNNCSDASSAFSNVVNYTTPSPLIGHWTAYDVSPILAGVGITGIEAEFRSNNTYKVISYADGSSSELTGTYVISDEPGSDGIYAITLNQSSPNSLTSEGIFKVYAATPDSMWYEVAQTDPAITGVTPPTVEGGFGSTSGGAFGNANIQKYNRD